MGDDFEFTPPPRREARTFEPPPWEKEAFEELRRKQDAAELERPAAEPTPEEPVVLVPEPGFDEPALAEEDEQESPGPGVSNGEMVAMLSQLAAQEPDAKRGLTTMALVVAAICGVFGLVLVVWGGVALANSGSSGRIGMIGGSLFTFLGLAAIGFAGWLTIKTLRQRGVL